MKRLVLICSLILFHFSCFAVTSLIEQRTAVNAADGLSKCQLFFTNDTVNSCTSNMESRTAGCSGCAKPGAAGTGTLYCQATENLYTQVNGTGSCNSLIQSTIVAWSYPSTACASGTTFVGPNAWDCRPSAFVQSIADNQKSNGYADPAIGCSSTNPCHIGTGNFTITEVDFAGEENIPSFVRTYNSFIQDDFADIGMGWRHNHSMRLELKAGRVIRMHRGDGQILVFNKVGLVWLGDADSKYQLTSDTNGYSILSQGGVVERYNLSGFIVSSTSAAGLITNYAYTGNQLLSVTGPFGHQIQFAWSTNEIRKVTMPDGSVFAYGTNAISNNLAGVTYPDTTKKLYLYENTNFPYSITGVLDQNNTRLSRVTYDNVTGRVSSLERANGVDHFDIQYTGMTTTVTDPLGNVTESDLLNILGIKHVAKVTNMSDGSYASATFDAKGNVLTYTNEKGVMTNYSYDSANRLNGVILAVGEQEEKTVAITYNDQWLTSLSTLTEPSVINGSLKQTSMMYEDLRFPNLPTSIAVSGFNENGLPIKNATSIAYNSSGQPLSIGKVGAIFSDIQYTYLNCTTGGQCGKVSVETTPAGNAYYTYNSDGTLASMTGLDGLTKTFNSDGSVSVSYPIPISNYAGLGNPPLKTHTSYDQTSRTLKVTNLAGRTLTYLYDQNGRIIKLTDPIGNYQTYSYDNLGNSILVASFDMNDIPGPVTSNSFDAKGNVSTASYGSRQYTYSRDVGGNIISATNPSGQNSEISVDSLNRPIKSINTSNGVTNFLYKESNVTSIISPNGSNWSFKYDDFGNSKVTQSSDSGSVIKTFDASGNVLSSTDSRGVSKSFAYDNAGRITSIKYPNSTEDISISWINSFKYGSIADGQIGNGNAESIYDFNGSRTYTYCTFGYRCKDEFTTKNNVHFTTTNTFTADGKVVGTIYPSGKVAYYNLDLNGRVIGVVYNGQVLMSSRTFTSDGSVKQTGLMPISNGGQINYDSSGLATTLNIGGLYSANFSRDANGNVLSDGSNTYAYDLMDQIISENTNSVSYDDNQNRKSDSNGMYDYLSNSNKMTFSPFGAVSTDQAGNITQIGQRSFSYNQAGRLASVSVNGSVVGSYTYDYLGRRASKTVNGQTILFHYGVNNELLSETKDDGFSLVDYVYDDRQVPIAQIKAGVLTIIHSDENGTPILGTDAVGNVVWKWDGDMSAANAPSINIVTINFRYPGQYYDLESGLHQNWFRDFDPLNNRYIEPDPIGINGGTNSYAYARNNNISNIDPYGLFQFVATGYSKYGIPTGFTYISGTSTTNSTNISVTIPDSVIDFLDNRLLNYFSNDLNKSELIIDRGPGHAKSMTVTKDIKERKLILLPADGWEFDEAANRPGLPGTLLIISHGNPGTAAGLTAEQLAEIIIKSGLWSPGMNIVHDAYNLGSIKNGFAQQMANILKTTYIAPNTYSYSIPQIFGGGSKLAPSYPAFTSSRGQWVSFTPQ